MGRPTLPNLWTCMAVLLLAGCGQQQRSAGPPAPALLADVTAEQVVQAAEDVLARLHFRISKADAEHGIVTTHPLSGAQLFEVWRGEIIGGANTAEANLHSTRRTVELRIDDEAGKLRTECAVTVERLSLPEHEVAGTAQAYRMYSQSTPEMQTLQLNPEQRRQMTWIDMGSDPALEAEILRRIQKTLDKQRPEGST